MAEPTVPEEVYREVAAAYTATDHWPTGARDVVASAYANERNFRHAVETAYRAGILAAQRAALIAMEQDRQRYGPTKAGNGVYDMCRQVVRRTLDEMAGADG